MVQHRADLSLPLSTQRDKIFRHVGGRSQLPDRISGRYCTKIEFHTSRECPEILSTGGHREHV